MCRPSSGPACSKFSPCNLRKKFLAYNDPALTGRLGSCFASRWSSFTKKGDPLDFPTTEVGRIRVSPRDRSRKNGTWWIWGFWPFFFFFFFPKPLLQLPYSQSCCILLAGALITLEREIYKGKIYVCTRYGSFNH